MMRKRLLTVIAAIGISIGLIASCHAADEKIDFKLRLKPGQIFEIREVWDVMGTVVDQTTCYDFLKLHENKIKLQILDVDKDGLVTAIVTLYPVKVKDISHIDNAQLSDFDSTSPVYADTLEVAVMNALSGKSFKFSIDSKGEPKDLEGLKALPPIVMAQLGDVSPELSEVVLNAIKSVVVDVFSACTAFFDNYPQKPVAINERWLGKSHAVSIISCKTQSFFKITNRTDGILTVKIYQEAKPDTATAADDKKILQIKMGGNTTGFATFDEATGAMKKLKVQGKLKGFGTLRRGVIWGEVPCSTDLVQTVEVNQIAQ